MNERKRTHPIYASLYDWYNRGAERTWLGKARRQALAHARGAVLEIGAGTGINLQHYEHVDSVKTPHSKGAGEPCQRGG